MIEALPPGAFGSAVTGIQANMAHRACKARFWRCVRFRLSGLDSHSLGGSKALISLHLAHNQRAEPIPGPNQNGAAYVLRFDAARSRRASMA
jgi:hypothetical protein